jgi:hypothetical protein
MCWTVCQDRGTLAHYPSREASRAPVCLLLILDNFEHLLPASGVVMELVLAASYIRSKASEETLLI